MLLHHIEDFTNAFFYVAKPHKEFWLLNFPFLHYEKKLTKNIRLTDILQIYTSI